MTGRGPALALLALLLMVASLSTLGARTHVPVEPLPCDEVIALEGVDGVRLACPDDPDIISSTTSDQFSSGYRYRNGQIAGIVRGPLLALHQQPIPINYAGIDDLRALPGVGAGMAQRFLEARRQHGPFCEAADLDRVPGLGPKKLKALASLLAFDADECR